jgi:O-antigen ligase
VKTKRSLIFAILCLVGLAVVIGTAVALSQQQTQRARGLFYSFPEPLTPPERGVGVNVALEQYDASHLQAEVAQIKQSGLSWIRQTFPWSQIEPEHGQYEWGTWDRIVQNSDDLGLIAVLDTAPLWAASSITNPPTSTLQFANFARALALRYGDRIDYYQIWDEPNLGDRWRGEVNPVEYAEMLRQARDAIKQVDPTATIVLAGLAPTVEVSKANLADWLFLRRLYEAGARDLFDVVAGKPYGFDTAPDDHRIDPNILNFQHLVLMREEMEQHGDAGKALWASQFGWNTAENSPWGRATLDQQRAYTQQAITFAHENWPWLGVMAIENWEPNASLDNPRWGFSIKHNLAQVLELSQGSGYYPAALQTRPGSPTYEPNPRATFTGEWRFSELGADWSATGDKVTIPFRGTDLALRVRRAADRANFYITIDGQPANALPRDERGAYLQLIPPDATRTDIQTIPVATGLADTDHVAEIVAERGWNQWSLIGWSVGRSEDRSGLNAAYDLLFISSILLAIGAVYFGRKADWGSFGRKVSAWWSRLGGKQQTLVAVTTAIIVYATAWMAWGVDIAAAYRRAGDTANIIATLAAATIFYVSPWLILTVISGLVLLALIILRLDLGLALVTLFAPFFFLPRQLFESAFSMSELILIMCVASAVLRGAWSVRKNRALGVTQHTPHITQLDWSVLVLLIVSATATLLADYRTFALREFRVIILEPIIYYALIRAAKLDRQAVWRIVDFLMLAGMLVAVIGLVQYAFNLNIITAEEGVRRLRSVYGSPNNVGLFLGRVFPIGLALLLLGRGQRRALYGLALIPIAAAILLSQSRGAIFIGVPLSILTIGALAGGRWLWASLGVIAVGAVAAIPLLNSPRMQALFSGEGGTSFFRVALWKSAVQMIRDHPLFGVGPDNFLYAYRGRYLLPEAWQEPALSHPHNVILDFGARLGLIGLGVFIWMQIAFWTTTLRAIRHAKASLRIDHWAHSPRSASEVGLIIGLAASMVDFLTHGLIDASYFVVDLAFVFMLTLALVQVQETGFLPTESNDAPSMEKLGSNRSETES